MLSIGFSVYFGLRNNSRSSKKDVQEKIERARKEAMEETKITEQLKHISDIVTQIKNELNTVREDVLKDVKSLREEVRADHEFITRHDEALKNVFKRLSLIEETLRFLGTELPME